MDPAVLKKTIDDMKGELAQLTTICNSPGFARWLDFYQKFKADASMQDAFCKLFEVAPANLPEMLATVDAALSQKDQVVTTLAPELTSVLTKFEQHPAIVWSVARILG